MKQNPTLKLQSNRNDTDGSGHGRVEPGSCTPVLELTDLYILDRSLNLLLCSSLKLGQS